MPTCRIQVVHALDLTIAVIVLPFRYRPHAQKTLDLRQSSSHSGRS
jgi:hypothetical protein